MSGERYAGLRGLFTHVRMRAEAAEYMRRMSALLCEMRGSSAELYFYLLADSAEGRPAMVTAAYVPWGQRTTASECALSLEGKLRSYLDIGKSGCALVGWAHSHGELPAFHSATDRGNTMGRALESEAYAFADTPLAAGEAAALVALSAQGETGEGGEKEEGSGVEHLVAVPPGAEIEVVRLKQVAYAYSVVYSVGEDKFDCAVGVRTASGECVMLEDVPLELVDDGTGDMPADNDAALREELSQKVEHGC